MLFICSCKLRSEELFLQTAVRSVAMDGQTDAGDSKLHI